MTKSKFEMTKSISKIVIGVGVGTVIDNVIAATLPGKAGKLAKVIAWIGSVGLGLIAAEQLDTAIDNYADDLVDMLDAEIEEDEY